MLDPRRVIVDQIVRDCYSKSVVVNGRNVPDMKYNTHLAIREYSQYPQSAPPLDIPPSQIGSVKNRILVVCTKASGRVLLQKGKYNDAKHVYQIGRTWDLEELLLIQYLQPDAIIMALNKEYYWKSGEGVERLKKFIHHVCAIYGKFTRRYPQISGITFENLGLPPLQARGSVSQERSGSTSGISPATHGRNPPAAPAEIAHYQGMDFTANGKLPTKPMVVMDVDRPSPNQSQRSLAETNFTADSVHVNDEKYTLRTAPQPYTLTSNNQLVHTLNSEQSFVFGGNDDSMKMPAISENADAATLPSTASLPRSMLSLQPSASISEKQSLHLKNHPVPVVVEPANHDTSMDSTGFKFEVPQNVDRRSHDFGIEEAELSETDAALPRRPSVSVSLKKRNASLDVMDDSTHVDAIDESIREIEDFMNENLGGQPQKENNEERSILSHDDSLITTGLSKVETAITETDSPLMQMKFEKDPEIDEILDEIKWDPTSSSDVILKKLEGELNKVKHRNVNEVITLDSGKVSLKTDGAASSQEMENILEVFKQMEVGFGMVMPKIQEIESNSKGLQVRAVNKKLLYNDLNEILNNVRVSSNVLVFVTRFREFERLELIPDLEGKLLVLFDALGTVGSTTSSEAFAKMTALREFQGKYEGASNTFIENFSAFVVPQFERVFSTASASVANFYPRNLHSLLRDLFTYCSIMQFIRDVSPGKLKLISEKVTHQISMLFEKVLIARLKLVESETPTERPLSSRISQDAESIAKKHGRFGSHRYSRSITSSEDVAKPVKKKSGEIGDPKIILRMVEESKEFMLVVQYFLGNFFRSIQSPDFTAFIKQNSFVERERRYDNPDFHSMDYKTSSHDLLAMMTASFGNYINRFLKKLVPAELITPTLMVELERQMQDAKKRDQDFIGFNFLLKMLERCKSLWSRFIANQVDSWAKADLRPKSGIIAPVKNLSQLVLDTETSLQELKGRRDYGDALVAIEQIICLLYAELTTVAVEFFSKDDPLLKSNTHDERERAHRNVGVMVNTFLILQQLNDLNSATTQDMKSSFSAVFSKVQGEYVTYIIHRNVGKMADFVKNHAAQTSRTKKEDRFLVKNLASTHTSKDMQPHIDNMYRKMEKHIVSANTVQEQDLLRKTWDEAQREVAQLFAKFDKVVKALDLDIDSYISQHEIRRLFNSHPSSRV